MIFLGLKTYDRENEKWPTYDISSKVLDSREITYPQQE